MPPQTRRTVRAPQHPEVMSPAFARWMAVQLVERADAAEGCRGTAGFVTRWELLAQAAEARSLLAKLCVQQQDYWTAQRRAP